MFDTPYHLWYDGANRSARGAQPKQAGARISRVPTALVCQWAGLLSKQVFVEGGSFS